MFRICLTLVLLNFYCVFGLQHAICKLQGNGNTISGRIDFYGLCDGGTQVIISIIGGNELVAEKSYALQIEEFAEQNKNFNPFNVSHGCPINGTIYSVGDLGNVNVSDNNNVQTSFVEPNIPLTGPNSIIGRYIRLYNVADNCIEFPQASLSQPTVLAECTLGISNEITFSDASVDNDNITAAYCAFNNSGVIAVIHIEKLNKTFSFTSVTTGLSANGSYTFSVRTFGDLIVGLGPLNPLNIIVQQQANDNGLLNFNTIFNLIELSDIIGHGLELTDSNNDTIGSCVIGVTNSSYVAPPIQKSSKKNSSTAPHISASTSPSTSNTVVWIAVGASTAAAAALIFGTIFYVKIKNSSGKNLYI